MDDNPLVSIIMPTYNREKTLPLAIQSVIEQTYENWELIVVDDRSTDNTRELIEGYLATDQRIRYVCNTRKKGPSGARNFGLEYAKGKYVAFLDSDDEWLQHHLIDSVKVLENEEVKVCFGNRYERKSGKLVRIDKTKQGEKDFQEAIQVLQPKIKGKLIFFGEGFYEYNLTERFCFFHINTMVFHKDILHSLDAFREDLPANEDYEFIFRVIHDYEFCFINNYHMIYNEGVDNLYAFVDRDNIDLDQLVYNVKLVEKLTQNILYKIDMHRSRKKFIRQSTKINNPKVCIRKVNSFIANKYFTIGFINRKTKRLKSLKFYMLSMFYKPELCLFQWIGELFLPFAFGKAEKKAYQINLN